jgi:diguanylate cyclase (GGDEF)-like protein
MVDSARTKRKFGGKKTSASVGLRSSVPLRLTSTLTPNMIGPDVDDDDPIASYPAQDKPLLVPMPADREEHLSAFSAAQDGSRGNGEGPSVSSLNPFVLRETRRLRDHFMNQMSLFLYLVALPMVVIRLALGYLPGAPPSAAWNALGIATVATGSLLLLHHWKPRLWIFIVFSWISAGVVAYLEASYGTDTSVGGMYLLALIVPALFFPLRWALLTTVGVSLWSLVPYFLAPTVNEGGLLSQLVVAVPCYFLLVMCANVTMSGARERWTEINKHRRLARDLAVLQELTTYMASTQDIQDICDTTVAHLRDSFGYRYISIYLMWGSRLRLMTQHGYEEYEPELPLGKGVMSRVAVSGEPVVIKDAAEESEFIYDAPGIRCEVCVPILRRATSGTTGTLNNGVSLGVINLEDTEPDALGEVDQNLLAAVAGALSVALENATLMQEWRERGARLELVNEVAQAVASKLDLAGVLHAACDALQTLAPVDRATLGIVSDDGQYMEIAAVDGITAPDLSQPGAVIALATFEPAAVARGQWLVLPELPPNSPFPYVQLLYEAGLRSHLAIPLLVGERVVGLFALSSVQPNAYKTEHLPLFESIAPHLATALQNAQLYRGIRLRAETDNLTGLLNLPTFYIRLKEALVEAQAKGEPVSVVMLDLDMFKSYNDSFGHMAGDSVLRQVAALIKSCLSSRDTAARYGGDEFALILDGVRADEALDAVSYVCETIGQTPFQPEDDPEDPDSHTRRGVAILSASAGIASYPDNGSDSEQLLQLADNALYEAKRRGRNRAYAYSNDGDSLTHTTDHHPARFKRFRSITDTDPDLQIPEEPDQRTASNDYLHAAYALASAIELRDGYTHGHAERVAFYATRLGEAVGLDASELAALRVAGLLHDIGKIALPPELSRKSSKLSDQEWEMVKQHPLHGENVLRPLRNFERVWPIISSHHENYDGTGYPNGLSGEEIPVGGRILHIADAYEVMTVSGRAFQSRAKSPNEAVTELLRCANTMFDRELVELFIQTVIGDPTKVISYNPETSPLTDELVNA